ncbi:hypothetical protein D3C75_1002980 [compost metagenome]
MPVAARLRNVIAQACAKGPEVAVGVAFLRTFACTQIEFALEIVVIQLATGQRGVGPPTVLLELGEYRGQVAVEFVVRIVIACFQILTIEARRHPHAPGFIEAIAAADVQVVAAAIGTGAAVLTVDVQMLTAAGDNSAPLAYGLPVLPVGLPLAAQFILMRT